MTFSSDLVLLDPSEITILRDTRQRSEIDVRDLLPSIRKNGVINPVVITREFVLVAGERRTESCRQLGIPVPCRFVEELSQIELQIIESEENVKRKDLSWQDQMSAIGRVHDLCIEQDSGWTMSETADRLSLPLSVVSECLSVRVAVRQQEAQALPPIQPLVSAKTRQEAYNAVLRKKNRSLGSDLEDLLGDGPAEPEIVDRVVTLVTKDGVSLPAAAVHEAPTGPTPPEEAILHVDFANWAESYRGEQFNLIHCDFPYGANVFGGAQGIGDKSESELYADEKEVYFDLLETFAKNFENFASHSCHVMWWLSFRHFEATKSVFRNFVPGIEWTLHPLIWHKSDNAGIISDSRRDPRHVYEMALLGRRGGRNSVRAVADLYSSPSDRSLHASAKPEPMIRHFFSMLCDEHSSVLDPTCGAGSAIRAAESLGARRVLGLELNAEHVETARMSLKNSRTLRDASERMG